MAQGATLLAYLVSGVFFILTLRGLSSPETARRGNTFGMVGMTIAIVTTLISPEVTAYVWIVVGILIGGTAGTIIAKR
ncbi:MAG: NAD synthetase, partial [Rhodospirillaceae bacterium]|nr:NAD synthetase [Rhodospirillaceae bacterium]